MKFLPSPDPEAPGTSWGESRTPRVTAAPAARTEPAGPGRQHPGPPGPPRTRPAPAAGTTCGSTLLSASPPVLPPSSASPPPPATRLSPQPAPPAAHPLHHLPAPSRGAGARRRRWLWLCWCLCWCLCPRCCRWLLPVPVAAAAAAAPAVAAAGGEAPSAAAPPPLGRGARLQAATHGPDHRPAPPAAQVGALTRGTGTRPPAAWGHGRALAPGAHPFRSCSRPRRGDVPSSLALPSGTFTGRFPAGPAVDTVLFTLAPPKAGSC